MPDRKTMDLGSGHIRMILMCNWNF